MSDFEKVKELDVLKFGKEEYKEAFKRLEKFFPDAVHSFVAIHGATMGRSTMDAKTRELIAIATFVTMGDAYHHIKAHMYMGLKRSLFTKEELTDVLLQLPLWIGVSRCEAAFHTLIEVLEELEGEK